MILVASNPYSGRTSQQSQFTPKMIRWLSYGSAGYSRTVMRAGRSRQMISAKNSRILLRYLENFRLPADNPGVTRVLPDYRTDWWRTFSLHEVSQEPAGHAPGISYGGANDHPVRDTGGSSSPIHQPFQRHKLLDLNDLQIPVKTSESIFRKFRNQI